MNSKVTINLLENVESEWLSVKPGDKFMAELSEGSILMPNLSSLLKCITFTCYFLVTY